MMTLSACALFPAKPNKPIPLPPTASIVMAPLKAPTIPTDARVAAARLAVWGKANADRLRASAALYDKLREDVNRDRQEHQ
jgi:hypothetical protein